jgi:zinc protease
MRRWRIGTAERLRALTRDDVVDYVKKYYRPSNIILSISGQLNIEDTLNEVVKLYGDVADPEEALKRDYGPEEPEQAGLRYNWQRGPIEQPRVALGFHVPGVLSSEGPALDVLAAILAEGRASVLNQYLRDEKALITSASAGVLAFRGHGYFEIDLQTDHPIEAQIGALAELENIKQFGVTRESLSRAKMLVAQKHYQSLETIDGVAHDLAYFESLGDWKKAAAYLIDINRVSVDSVVQVAKKYLTVDNLTAFEYIPETVSRSLTDPQYRQLVIDQVPAAMEERSLQELPTLSQIPIPDPSITLDLVRPSEKRSILRGTDVYIL